MKRKKVMRKINLILILCFLIPVFAVNAYAAQRQQVLNYVLAYLEHKNVDKAVQTLSDLIKSEPDYQDAYFHRGRIYLTLEKIEKAESDFNKSIEISADYSYGYLGKAFVALTRADYEGAITDLTTAVTLNANFGIAYFNRAIAYSELKQFPEAFMDLRRARERGVDVDEAFFREMWSLANPDEFIAGMTKMIEDFPESGDAYYYRGVAYYYGEKYKEALNDLEKAAALGSPVEEELLLEIKTALNKA